MQLQVGFADGQAGRENDDETIWNALAASVVVPFAYDQLVSCPYPAMNDIAASIGPRRRSRFPRAGASRNRVWDTVSAGVTSSVRKRCYTNRFTSHNSAALCGRSTKQRLNSVGVTQRLKREASR